VAQLVWIGPVSSPLANEVSELGGRCRAQKGSTEGGRRTTRQTQTVAQTVGARLHPLCAVVDGASPPYSRETYIFLSAST